MQHLQKTGGAVAIMVNQVLKTSHLPASPAPRLCVSVAAPSSILRTLFQVPYPATPLFATLTKTAVVCTQNSQFGNAHLTLLGSRLWPREKKEGAACCALTGGFRDQDLIWLEAPSQVTAALRK